MEKEREEENIEVKAAAAEDSEAYRQPTVSESRGARAKLKKDKQSKHLLYFAQIRKAVFIACLFYYVAVPYCFRFGVNDIILWVVVVTVCWTPVVLLFEIKDFIDKPISKGKLLFALLGYLFSTLVLFALFKAIGM